MKILKKGWIACILVALSLFYCFGLAGCVRRPLEKEAVFLKTDGGTIRNGKGEEVVLRGVNAGGLCVIECWMNGFSRDGVPDKSDGIRVRDHKSATKVLLKRFGKEKTKALWQEYRENWWSEADFKNCADMGMNVIRLPFTYMTVDFDAIEGYENAGKNYDFTILDEFVAGAAKYGIYTILDLHGAYGSQNGKDHSGEVLSAADVDFYSNETYMTLTENLWRATAEHFKDEPYVAGYDILNEPAETTETGGTLLTEKRHWDFMNRAYNAIRKADREHICVFESCWDGENLPAPSEYGWENCMYSFHHYSSKTGADNYAEHVPTMNAKFASVSSQNFGIPVQMGEFTCYEGEEAWEYSLESMNRFGWSWCNWTYKINNTSGNSPWGIVRVETSESDKVNVHTDSYETIVKKFRALRTTDSTAKYTFASGRTLFDLIKKYCLQERDYHPVYNMETEYMLSDGNGLFYSFASDPVFGDDVLVVTDSPADAITFVKSGYSDGSYYLRQGELYLSSRTVAGKNVLAGRVSRNNAARFFVWENEAGEYMFSSYATGEYWTRVAADNRIYVSARDAENGSNWILLSR